MPLWIGLPAVALIGTGYTLMGGMWSVTLTDALQVTLLLLGLVVLAFVTLMELGGGNAWGGLAAYFAVEPPWKIRWGRAN